MAFVAIEYWLKNIFDDYYTFIPLAIKHKIEIGCISITRSCAWSNTGSHLLKAQDKLKTFKGVFNYDPVDEK